MKPFDYLRQAVSMYGKESRLAVAIGFSQHAVWHAVNKRRQCSPQMAIAIHKATKGKIRKEQLRPDIFGGIQ